MIVVQLTDLHLRPEGQACHRVSETNMLAERAMRAVTMLRVKPDAIILSGDLVDSGAAAEYRVLKGILGRHVRDTPVYMVPGNHDDRAVLRAELAGWPGIGANPDFIQYTVENLPVRLVLLDTLVPGQPHGELCAARLEWLDRTLAAAPDKPTIVVMHHPPFVCGIAHMDAINLRNSDAFADVLARHRQVERILCGHHHRPVVARVAHAIASIAPSVAHQLELDLHGGDALFVMEPPAFQIHLWTPAAGIVSHTAYVEQYPGPYPFLADARPA